MNHLLFRVQQVCCVVCLQTFFLYVVTPFPSLYWHEFLFEHQHLLDTDLDDDWDTLSRFAYPRADAVALSAFEPNTADTQFSQMPAPSAAGGFCDIALHAPRTLIGLPMWASPTLDSYHLLPAFVGLSYLDPPPRTS